MSVILASGTDFEGMDSQFPACSFSAFWRHDRLRLIRANMGANMGTDGTFPGFPSQPEESQVAHSSRTLRRVGAGGATSSWK
jgi:hypothetical protein